MKDRWTLARKNSSDYSNFRFRIDAKIKIAEVRANVAKYLNAPKDNVFILENASLPFIMKMKSPFSLMLHMLSIRPALTSLKLTMTEKTIPCQYISVLNCDWML
jgi:hypothetical protein